MKTSGVNIKSVSKATLLTEFSLQNLAQNGQNEGPWRQLLSELNGRNKETRQALISIEQQEQEYTRVSMQSRRIGQKFTKLIFTTEDDNILRNKVKQLEEQVEQVQNKIILEQDKVVSYEGMRNKLRRILVYEQTHISELTTFITAANRQQSRVQMEANQFLKDCQFFQYEQDKGQVLIQNEGQYLNQQLGTLKKNQKLAKHKVNTTYKEFTQLHKSLSNKLDNLASTEVQINKLDKELEIKRLAKIDSQMLLLELEEVKILIKVFIGKGFINGETLKQFKNSDYWVTQGRFQVVKNLSQFAKLEGFEQTNKEDFDFLQQVLDLKFNQLLVSQFSLTHFLNKLSDFFEFCEMNVQQLATQLIQIFKYEVSIQQLIIIYLKQLKEISLKNGYDGLIQENQTNRLLLCKLEQQFSMLEEQQINNNIFDNLVDVIQSDDNTIQCRSVNTLEMRKDNIYISRTLQTRQVIWRLLTFLTNGVYRWVSMILNLSKLVQRQSDLKNICLQINQHSDELFKSLVENDSHTQIIKIINSELSLLNRFASAAIDKVLKQQGSILFAYIKNDFILYNWGNLMEFQKVLKAKVYEFHQLAKNKYSRNEDRFEQCEAYIQFLEGFSTYICPQLIPLCDEAMIKFQGVFKQFSINLQIFVQFLDRFVLIFKGIKQMESEMLLQSPQSCKLTIQQRRGSLLKSADRRSSLQNEEEEPPIQQPQVAKKNQNVITGLFGQSVDFKKTSFLKKCQQYQHYFDEKSAPLKKKTMMNAMFETIMSLSIHEKEIDDPEALNKEEDNLQQNYLLTRQKIIDNQGSNIAQKLEAEKLKYEREMMKQKNYMEKSEKLRNRENQMSSLVIMNKKRILPTQKSCSVFRGEQNQFSESKNKPKALTYGRDYIKSGTSQNIVQQLHNTYTGFHNVKDRFQENNQTQQQNIKTNNKEITSQFLPKVIRQTNQLPNNMRFPTQTSENAPYLSTQPNQNEKPTQIKITLPLQGYLFSGFKKQQSFLTGFHQNSDTFEDQMMQREHGLAQSERRTFYSSLNKSEQITFI